MTHPRNGARKPAQREGLLRTNYCPRGHTDCQSLSQIIAGDHESFVCCGENDGMTRKIPQDRYRMCWKTDDIDELSNWDRRDLITHLAVIGQALALIEEYEVQGQND